MITISLITDEISADPETAIELGVAWGIRSFELRGFFGERVPCFSDYQKHYLKNVLEDYQARIVAIAPGLFKVPFPAAGPERFSLPWLERGWYEDWSEAQKTIRYHLNELLPATLDYANELGAGKVLIFGFDRAGAPAGDPPEALLEILRLAAERAGAAGSELVLENEAGFWADSGERTAAIRRAVNHPALGINWDPGNAFCAGDDAFPTGYAEVRGSIRHVHFKDARWGPDGQPEYCLEGQIDWRGQVKALVEDGYDSYISVETHTRPRIAHTQALLERLRGLLEECA